MLHDSTEERLFPKLEPEVLQCLREHGSERTIHDGEFLFREGELNQTFYAILDGKVRVTKRLNGDQQLLVVHEAGSFTGEISLLTGEKAVATGQAVGETRVIVVGIPELQQVIAACPSLSQTLLTALTGRAREVGRAQMQQEKLASLGKLSAGLAHEINNPAAAAMRAVSVLRENIDRLQLSSIKNDGRFTEQQRARLLKVRQDLSQTPDALLGPLERSDREEELSQWLEDHDVPEAWELSPALVNAGVTNVCLHDLGEELHSEELTGALTWMVDALQVNSLAKEVESSVARISDLVKSMKEYSFMDQAAFQEIDIHQGLDNTLKMFAYRLKSGVKLVRNYDHGLPKICAYASELNQVWTNIIDNALDAMDGQGTLTVTTSPSCDGVMVEIGDTGPGIPADIQTHIFDPFFTTKPVGEGTGLGLDISRRIIVNHHGGSVSVHSKPGDTRFQILLPLEPPKEKR